MSSKNSLDILGSPHTIETTSAILNHAVCSVKKLV